MNHNKLGLLTLLPPVMAIIAAYFRNMILIPIIVFIIFGLVAVLPFAHGHENLWLFLICTISSVPLNLFFLIEYPILQMFLHPDTDMGLLWIISTIEAMLIVTGVEEVIVGFFGRLIWRKQYRLNIPEV